MNSKFIKRNHEIYCNGVQLTPFQKLKYFIIEHGGYFREPVETMLEESNTPLALLNSFTLKYIPIYNNNVFAWYFFVLELPGRSPSILMLRADLSIPTPYTQLGIADYAAYSGNTTRKTLDCANLIQSLNLPTEKTDTLIKLED